MLYICPEQWVSADVDSGASFYLNNFMEEKASAEFEFMQQSYTHIFAHLHTFTPTPRSRLDTKPEWISSFLWTEML